MDIARLLLPVPGHHVNESPQDFSMIHAEIAAPTLSLKPEEVMLVTTPFF